MRLSTLGMVRRLSTGMGKYRVFHVGGTVKSIGNESMCIILYGYKQFSSTWLWPRRSSYNIGQW